MGFAPEQLKINSWVHFFGLRQVGLIDKCDHRTELGIFRLLRRSDQGIDIGEADLGGVEPHHLA